MNIRGIISLGRLITIQRRPLAAFACCRPQGHDACDDRIRERSNRELSADSLRSAEAYRVSFHGTRGSVTLGQIERLFLRRDGGLVDPLLPERIRLVVQPLFHQRYELALPAAEGLHGGYKLMLKHLFRGARRRLRASCR